MLSIIAPGGEGNASVAVGPTLSTPKQAGISSRYAAKLVADEAAEAWWKEKVGSHNLQDRLPLPGWWARHHGLSAPGILLIFSFQYWFQRSRVVREGARFACKSAAEWQAACGVTPDQWKGARESASPLLTATVSKWAGKKSTFLRPTEAFMGVFGLTLDVYDTLGPVLIRHKKGKPLAGAPAPKDVPLSAAEQAALQAWHGAKGHWPQ